MGLPSAFRTASRRAVYDSNSAASSLAELENRGSKMVAKNDDTCTYKSLHRKYSN